MKLNEFFEKNPTVTPESIAKKSGASVATVRNAARGLRITIYSVAKGISKATGGKVSIAELCE